MNHQEDSDMDDGPGIVSPYSDLDPAVKARLQSFPDGGDERRLLEAWIEAQSPAALAWGLGVTYVLGTLRNTTTAHDVKAIRPLVCPEDPRIYYSGLLIDPEVLTILFGDPKEYNVKSCSDDALLCLLRCGKKIDILIGSWLLSKITGDESGSPHSGKFIEAANRLNKSFTRKYCGPGALWLDDALRQYMEMYKRDKHYGKTIVVLQSSGTGKSRTMAELAKMYWGVTVCFRGMGSSKPQDPRDGFPLGDEPVCKFLSNPGSGLWKGEEIAAAFIGALFFVLCGTIRNAKSSTIKNAKSDTTLAAEGDTPEAAKRREAFDRSWGVPNVGEPDVSPRAENFKAVREMAQALLASNSREIIKARRFIPAHFSEKSPVIPQGIASAQTALHSSGAVQMQDLTKTAVSSTPSAGQTAKEGIVPWVQTLYNLLVEKSAKELDKERCELKVPCFTFIFDECSLLNFCLNAHRGVAPLNRITLLAVQRIIKACDGFNFWFFMLDTTSGLHDVYPAANKRTGVSWRLPGEYASLPLWPNLPFDVMVPPPKDLPKTPLEALCLDRLHVYGRPLWSTYRDDELMEVAVRKLVCENPVELLKVDVTEAYDKLKLQVLALHSTRFILNLRAEGAANTMAIASVKSHLRFLTHCDAATGMVTSVVPSEPILAIAAGKFLLDDKNKYRRAMRILVDELLLSNDIIAQGKRGETLAQIILVVNRDATVHEAGGQLCVVEICDDTRKITERKYDGGQLLDGNLHYAVRPFTLASYLGNLVDDDKMIQFNGAFDSGLLWAKQVHMNFTHFEQLEDFVPSCLSFELVVRCWRRGIALQCVDGQTIIDNILIGYRGDLSKPFDPKMFVFIVLKIKNGPETAGSESINTITCPFLTVVQDEPGSEPAERWKPEYMVILMDMGASACFQSTDGKLVQVTSCEAVKSKAWAAYEEGVEYKAVRINIRGLTPYRSVAEWAKDIFRLETPNANLLPWSEALESTLNVTQGFDSNLPFEGG